MGDHLSGVIGHGADERWSRRGVGRQAGLRAIAETGWKRPREATLLAQVPTARVGLIEGLRRLPFPRDVGEFLVPFGGTCRLFVGAAASGVMVRYLVVMAVGPTRRTLL